MLFYVAIAVAIFIFSNYQNRLRRQRSRDMQMLGLRLGFENFNPNRDDIFARGWGFLSRLSQGNERYAFNLLRGTYQEQPLFVFDYHFQTGSGKSKKEHYCTIFMLIEKEVFPQVTIRPENLRERIAMALGIGNEIQFESAEFSKTFSVRSNDKKFAYDVCNAQMMEYLLANQDLQIEIQGPVISLAFEPQLPVGRIEFNLQRLAQIRSLLPKYIFT
ncbi:MAG TPA: DUF3137 domain-containing protein, partial [Candidatus Baltobacteraceae bacterium]|nr:DUF3137 domain-containing protein [Candidatus Baltobacteraceae bacterium]